ncbi:MAG: hypothetical protein JXA73_14780 [Acidobacteria bacterium]|nr:hypothetical protein [Acidobacteriota bacterium]
MKRHFLHIMFIMAAGWALLSLFPAADSLFAGDRIRAGTIEIHSRAGAKADGVLTGGFNLTNMEIDESLKLNVVFKKDRENERTRVYELERAAVDFQGGLKPARTGLETEVAFMDINAPEMGRLKKPLDSSECELTLIINLVKKTYRISGRVHIQGIPFSQKGVLTSQVAGSKPVREDVSDEWTEDRNEEIEINGSLDPNQKDAMKGSKDLAADAPEEFRKWTDSFWQALFGGEMKNTVSWDIRIPTLIIERKGEDITDPDMPVEETVGKRIKLVGRAEPSHLKVEDPQWRISGKHMKEFKADISRSEVVPLDPEQDLKREEVEFYWHDKGDDLTVEFCGRVEGDDLTAETRFKIDKPDISLRTTPRGANEFKTLYSGESLTGGNCCYREEPEEEDCRKLKEEIARLDDNDPSDRWMKQRLEKQYRDECQAQGVQYQGIVFDANPPENMKGELEYIQLVHRRIVEIEYEDRGGTLVPAKRTTWTTEEALDGCYFYPKNHPPYDTEDRPGFGIAGGSKYRSLELKYKMYLMFRPESDENDSQWVPIKMVSWTWKGAAECVEGKCREVTEDAVFPAADTASDTSDYPLWSCCSGNAGTANTSTTVQ